MARIEDWQMKQRCWDNGIILYPKPIERGMKSDVVIELEIRGQTKTGKEVYKQDKKGQEAISNKMKELYLELYFSQKHKFKPKEFIWDFQKKCYISKE